MPMQSHEEIRLLLSEEVERLLEERQIGQEDVRKVIFHAESTGDKFIDPVTGQSLACLRPVRVNYWVQYSAVGEEFRVHSAYSHRMELKR